MRFAVSFIDSAGRCAITGKVDPMDFVVPIPDGMDSFDAAVFALGEVARVRAISPRPLPALAEVRSRIVPDDDISTLTNPRPLLAAVPDRIPT